MDSHTHAKALYDDACEQLQKEKSSPKDALVFINKALFLTPHDASLYHLRAQARPPPPPPLLLTHPIPPASYEKFRS